jgi:hypothetical protein
MSEELGYEVGSGNVFADLGLPDAEELKAKSDLAIEIVRIIDDRGLRQAEAAGDHGRRSAEGLRARQREAGRLLDGAAISVPERTRHGRRDRGEADAEEPEGGAVERHTQTVSSTDAANGVAPG